MGKKKLKRLTWKEEEIPPLMKKAKITRRRYEKAQKEDIIFPALERLDDGRMDCFCF